MSRSPDKKWVKITQAGLEFWDGSSLNLPREVWFCQEILDEKKLLPLLAGKNANVVELAENFVYKKTVTSDDEKQNFLSKVPIFAEDREVGGETEVWVINRRVKSFFETNLQVKEEKRASWLPMLAGFMVMVLTLVGTWYFLKTKTEKVLVVNPVSLVGTVTIVPTQETQKVARILVLNGTKISGLAEKVRLILENGGFGSVTTGNASKQTYADTLIGFSDSSLLAKAEEIKKLLENDYSVSLDASASATNSADIVVIVGAR